MLHSTGTTTKTLGFVRLKEEAKKSFGHMTPPKKEKKKKKDEVWRGGGKVRKTRQYVRREAQHKAGRYFSCNVIPSDLASLILFFFFPFSFCCLASCPSLLSCFAEL